MGSWGRAPDKVSVCGILGVCELTMWHVELSN
jgi:hypothetical protein